MEHDESDLALVRQAQRGNKRAFDLLVIKYQHRILTLVQRFMKDHSESMDVAQEAFIKAYRSLKNFRGESAFYTWLYRIAVNTAKNYLVSRGRRPPDVDILADDAVLVEGNEALKSRDTPEHELNRDRLKTRIQEVLAKLPEDLRVALMLREFDGLSYEDIAAVMDCPVGTVRSRIFRAREAIEQEIAPLL
ncbi:RNA polymerase sigma factor RpoE [Pokkaliibacter sp. CJK22405]|uniref:RNA polymerase sigma factor RpoE n=1 Tax=Pokkaliibacter sp. CJK22405 TaxID=3384615 RepID=UPI003984AB2A